MLLTFPDVLTPDELRACVADLSAAPWTDGRSTAGSGAVAAKHNEQLPAGDATAQRWGNLVLDRLGAHPGFLAATLPLKVLPPLFNRYAGGGTYGEHVDNAIRALPGTTHRVRTDISATLFLADPADYDGGELDILDTFGTQSIKLPAGHLVIYPGTSVHRVRPVTRGARLAAVFWIQSLVAADGRRRMLWDLDQAVQSLTATNAGHPALVGLTGVYHNLLREWSQT